MSQKPRGIFQWLTVLLAAFFVLSVTSYAQLMQGPTTIRYSVHNDISQPLSVMAQHAPPGDLSMHEAEPLKRVPLPAGLSLLAEDPVHQMFTPLAVQSPPVKKQFDGVGQGQYGYTVNVAPPDTNGAVGATQYVQWVNLSFMVFDKATGNVVLGPVAGNTLWSGFGGGCQSYNDGDPVVVYDKLANRWVMSQFAVSGSPYLQCIAVSQTSDATGAWYRYSFQYSNFDDYPKMGVWPDAYYETFDMFQNGATYVGPDACAYDRIKMLAGQPATQVCFQQSAALGPLLPADVDGTTPPPAGSPNYMLTYGTNSLDLYKFHVDFTTPTNSTFSGPTVLNVAAFSPLCGGGTCVPQPGTTQTIDSLGDRLMYRLAYRNFGTHESLVVSHSVVAGSSGGIRWYEIQNPGGTAVVAQQSTYAPDSKYRWMPSVAMDMAGDLAVGYSVSSSSVYPSIAYTGRLATDPVNTLQTETTVVTGTGSQTGGLSRWGDYSAMQVDPVDDCTFWYTQEYMKTTGSFNWNTLIASFKFPNCGSAVTISPTSLSFASQLVSTSSSSQAVTVTNSSSSNVGISSIAVTGDYSQTNNCPIGSTLAGSSSCTINVTFTPTTTGTRAGTLTIVDDSGTQTASLTGTGASPVSLAPAAVDFGKVGVTSASSPQTVTLTNGQASQLTGVSISISGTNAADFTQTNNCGTAVAANSGCSIYVTFQPSTYTTESATLTVTDSAGTQTAILSGTGADITPPTTQVTTPVDGATVVGTITISATATDNVGVTSIQIYVDGLLMAKGTSSPLNYKWNSALMVGNGKHTIYSKASDAAGNTNTSTTVTVTVNNPIQQLIQNSSFETGTMAYWTAGGVYTPVVTTAQRYGGVYSVRLGSNVTPEPNGDSSLYQTVTIPSTASTAGLGFYYWASCGDTVSNDWQEVQVQNTAGVILVQGMKLCSNTQTWTYGNVNLKPYIGQTIRVYFNVHGNGNNKLTYMYLDNVTVTAK